MNTDHKILPTRKSTLNPHLLPLGWRPFFTEELPADWHRGPGRPMRVVGQEKNRFLIHDGETESWASVAGRFRKQSVFDYPTVGDWVLAHDGLIIKLLPRYSLLYRKAAGSRDRLDTDSSEVQQLIGANIDTAMIVCGLDLNYNLRRIERLLALVYSCGVAPVIVLSKADLHPDPESCKAQVEAVAFGVPVHLLSRNDEEGLHALEYYFTAGTTCALLGSSGAGKSTLINRLYGREIRITGAVSDKLGKGRHVTSSRALLLLPAGGMVIDNPGMREIGLGLGQDQAGQVFPEIEELGRLCRFADCRHQHEPGCQVLAAVAAGQLAEQRLASYQKLLREMSYADDKERCDSVRVVREQQKSFTKMIRKVKKGERSW